MPQRTELDYTQIMQMCEKPFALEDHSPILFNGTISAWFIKKAALRRRLYELDPRYSTTLPEMVGVNDDVVLMRGALQFLGRNVGSIGTGIIQTTKKDKDRMTVPLEGFDLARSIAKAHKTAASDLLPRLCVEVNIGAYMKDLTRDDIKTEATFKAWLEKQVHQWEGRYHWSANGKGTLFGALAKAYGLTWETVRVQLEPGRTLNSLKDISLTDVEAVKRLGEIKTPMLPAGGQS